MIRIDHLSYEQQNKAVKMHFDLMHEMCVLNTIISSVGRDVIISQLFERKLEIKRNLNAHPDSLWGILYGR